MSSSSPSEPKTLVLGATGATGQHVVNFLLQANKPVRVIVRDKTKFSQIIQKLNTSKAASSASPLIDVVEKPLGDMNKAELAQALAGCDTVASCLGHNMTFSGMFGSKDRMLCTDAAKNICNTAADNKQKIKFVMMNTVGAYNNKLKERESASWGMKAIISTLSYIIPPQWDNMAALNYLNEDLGNDGKKNPFVDWIVVRPDTLLDEDKPSPVQAFPSPLSNVITNAGTISRISVARFMTDLALHQGLFDKYKFQTPVVYNKLPEGAKVPQ